MLGTVLNFLGVGKAIPFLITAAVVMAAGFAAAEVYEHRAPWGLGQQLSDLRDSIPDKLKAERTAGEAAGAKAQADHDAPVFQQWADQLQQCRSDRDAARTRAAQATQRAEAGTGAQVSAAYQLGRATCGASNANPSPDPVGDLIARSVSASPGADLGDLINAGAYTPR